MPFDRDASRYKCRLCCCCQVHSKWMTMILGIIDAALSGINFVVLLPVLLVTGLGGGDFYAGVFNLSLLVFPALACLLLICALRRESPWLLLPFLALQAFLLILTLGLTGTAVVRTTEGFEYFRDGQVDTIIAKGAGNATEEVELRQLDFEERKEIESHQSGRNWGLALASLGTLGALVLAVLSMLQAWAFAVVHRCFLCFRHQRLAAAAGGGGGRGGFGGAKEDREPLDPSAPPPPYSAAHPTPLYPEMKEIV